jgi:hypothetical protein
MTKTTRLTVGVQVGQRVPLLLTAFLVAVAVNLLGPTLAAGLIVVAIFGFSLILIGYHRPAIYMSLFVVALPLLGDEPLVGPFRPSILFTPSLLVFAVLVLLRSRQRLLHAARELSGVVTGLVLLASLGVVSVIANYDEEILLNLLEAVLKPVYFGTAMVITLAVFNSARNIRILSWATVVGSVATAVYALATYAVAAAAGEVEGISLRAGGTLGWNSLGSYMVLTSPFTLGFASVQQRRLYRTMLYLAFGVQLLALFASLTLASMFGLVTALGIYFLLKGRRGVGLLKYGALVAVISVVIIAFLPNVVDKMAVIEDRFLGRMATYEAGFRMVAGNILFGVGSKNVVAYLLSDRDVIATSFGYTYSVPHNVFLNTLVQKGIFVFAALVGTLVVFGRKFLSYYRMSRKTRARGMAVGMLAGMAGFLQQDLTNNILLNPRIGIFFFLYLPILMCYVFAQDEGEGLSTGRTTPGTEISTQPGNAEPAL